VLLGVPIPAAPTHLAAADRVGIGADQRLPLVRINVTRSDGRTTQGEQLTTVAQRLKTHAGISRSQLTIPIETPRWPDPAGTFTYIAQRLLALVGCIWNNWRTGASDKRSLIAYDTEPIRNHSYSREHG
jgi:hypothetical protein